MFDRTFNTNAKSVLFSIQPAASTAEWRNDRHYWIDGFHQSAAWTENVERTPAPLMS